MRRVYYSYALSFLTQSTLWQGLLLGASIAAFGRLTHVASIAHNLTGTTLGNIPQFVWGAFEHALVGGEVLTVLVTLFMLMLSLMLSLKITRIVRTNTQFA